MPNYLAASSMAQHGLADTHEAEAPHVTGDIAISPALEAVLAPAILPRTWLNQQILLAIQEVCVIWMRLVQALRCAVFWLTSAGLHSVGFGYRFGHDRQVPRAEACRWAAASIC